MEDVVDNIQARSQFAAERNDRNNIEPSEKKDRQVAL